MWKIMELYGLMVENNQKGQDFWHARSVVLNFFDLKAPCCPTQYLKHPPPLYD